MEFTVSAWIALKDKYGNKFGLETFVTYDGRFRPKDCSWCKIVEANNKKEAQNIGLELIKSGDPGDDINSIPIILSKVSSAVIEEKAAQN